MSSKFDGLTAYLIARREPHVTLSFEQVEGIVGPLPPSARRHAPYWHESPTHTITHAWLRAGYVKSSVSMTPGVLTLRRDPNAAAAWRRKFELSDVDRDAVGHVADQGALVEHAPDRIEPAFPGATEFLQRVRACRGLPERNMEELVKELLVRLGHDPTSVIFQIGRVDVIVRDGGMKVCHVFEVKKSLSIAKDRDSALRQGFDYAARSGARHVVISDADTYEIYDRTAGLDHGSMLKAKFRLTAFRECDAPGLDLLRPTPPV